VEECGPCPVFASITLAFALQLRKKHGKTLVRVRKPSARLRKTSVKVEKPQSKWKNLSQSKKNLSQNSLIKKIFCSKETLLLRNYLIISIKPSEILTENP